jgi:hypothetical protein
MPAKLIYVMAALSILSSAAVALTVAKSDVAVSVHDWAYPAKADFKQTFGAFANTSASDPESVAADRERLRAAALRRLHLSQSGED